jgi:hypothetical protein
MKEPNQLSYATPDARTSKRLLGRGPCIFVALCAVIMVWFGIWYIQRWHSARQWKVEGFQDDLPLGIGAITLGITFVGLSIYLFRYASAAKRLGE